MRAAPEEQFRELCLVMGISFSKDMLQWDKKPVDFHTEQNGQHEKFWYDKLFSSSQVNPPTEVPPTIEMFPEFIQEYLRTANLPVFAELSKTKIIKDGLRHELNEREFKVQVTSGNIDQLFKFGLISDSVAIGEQISIKLKDIDPVYAITNEPTLAESSEFGESKGLYVDELKIVYDALSKFGQNEHRQELEHGRGVPSR